MKIELQKVTVRELTADYADNQEKGVVAYGGRLDVRPPYQREFVYKDRQRDAVVATVRRGFPLNVMYWARRPDGTLEVLDGQQRTISLCQFVAGDYSVDWDGHPLAFYNLKPEQKAPLLDYELMVYVCEGTETEKLDWFRTINIAGEKLTEQELRNAVYAGPWVSDARRFFSKTGGPAYVLGQDYVNGTPNRQDYLETALEWISPGAVEAYMSQHQHDPDAKPLRAYFEAVLDWVKTTFPTKRRELMRSVDWGTLYLAYKDAKLDPAALEARIKTLLADDEIRSQSGIYAYALTGQERHLNLRAFTPNQKQRAYEKQQGVCPVCKNRFELSQMEGDHITPWHEGGKTVDANLQMLCKDDNRRKGGK